MTQTPQAAPSVSTGIEGLDDILGGGFTPNRLYLLEGEPGSGKTTMGLQFLLAGVQAGETVLYVTLSETRDELLETAASHGWSLDGIHIHELLPMGDQLDPESQYTMFHPSEVELAETTTRMLSEVERLQPQRVVFDSLAEIRLLAGTLLRFRRQVLALKQYFAGRGTTALLLDDITRLRLHREDEDEHPRRDRPWNHRARGQRCRRGGGAIGRRRPALRLLLRLRSPDAAAGARGLARRARLFRAADRHRARLLIHERFDLHAVLAGVKLADDGHVGPVL